MCVAVIIFCLLAVIGEIPWLINEFKKLYQTDNLSYRVYHSKNGCHPWFLIYESDNRNKALAAAEKFAISNGGMTEVYKITVKENKRVAVLNKNMAAYADSHKSSSRGGKCFEQN